MMLDKIIRLFYCSNFDLQSSHQDMSDVSAQRHRSDMLPHVFSLLVSLQSSFEVANLIGWSKRYCIFEKWCQPISWTKFYSKMDLKMTTFWHFFDHFCNLCFYGFGKITHFDSDSHGRIKIVKNWYFTWSRFLLIFTDF